MNKMIIGLVVVVLVGGIWLWGGGDKQVVSEGVQGQGAAVSEMVSAEVKDAVSGSNLSVDEKFGVGQKITMYKSPNCGCCVGYAEELERRGFEVETVSTTEVSNIKAKHGIPANKQSCHTMTMGDYFIEGHVPMEAVAKLLQEKPQIDGIGLPNMPSGTPGMPGPKRAPYEVYQSVDGEFSEFVKI